MTEPSPADRASRVLADIAGESRPRLPEDALDPGIPVAATVVLLRDGGAGPEALLIERPDRGSFAGAWVFPGGKLEQTDRLADDEPEEDAARRAAVRETWEETGLVLDADTLVTLSVWDPPPGLPLRIRTWFFVAPAPAGDLVLSADEAVAADWVAPDVLLARHTRGEVTLYPPTWVTLRGLAGAASVVELIDTARTGGHRRFETVARRTVGGTTLLWPEDAEYDGSSEGTARHRLEVGELPWRYTRED
ncbi:MAG: NUDIX domain-containing protein [Microbacterium sp.]